MLLTSVLLYLPWFGARNSIKGHVGAVGVSLTAPVGPGWPTASVQHAHDSQY